MQIPDQTKLKQKIQSGVLILLITATMTGCGGGGSSTPGSDITKEDIASVLKKAGPRREVCWKGKSRLKEIELQREGKLRRKKLECNLITRRSLARKKAVLALR